MLKGALTYLSLASLVFGCNSSDETIAKLEARVASLEEAMNQSRANDEALRKTFTAANTDLSSRLYIAGIVDEKNQNVGHWWCSGDGACGRAREDCAANERLMKPREVPPCEQRRVAYCGGVRGMNCFGSLSICRRVQGNGEMCKGVQ